MSNRNGCDPSWSQLRCEMELRKQDYLSKSSLDQCVLRARPSEDPDIRAKLKNNVLSPCDPQVLQLSFPWETVPRILARLATGIFPWMLDSTIPTSSYPDEADKYWRNSLADTFNHLEKLQDTADFHANNVLRLFYLFGGGIPPGMPGSAPPGVPTDLPQTMPADVAARLRDALHRFKYWIDEPPTSDPSGVEMTFWSENHQIEFATAQYLAGQLWPNDYFFHSGIYGRDHMRRARPRLMKWLDRRLAFGFSEWNSPDYYNEDIPPLLNLVDFCSDTEISRKAAIVLDIVVFDLGRFSAGGSFGVSAGRAYFEQKNCGLAQSGGNLVEILFGTRGVWVAPDEPSAIAFATSSRYVPPDVLLAIGQDVPDHFIDRTRVSINLEEAWRYGIGFSSEDDIVFWWGNGAFYTEQTLDGTRRVAHDRGLIDSGPFVPLGYEEKIEKFSKTLTTIATLGLGAVLPDDISVDLATVVTLATAEAVLLGAGALAPPPFNIGFGAAGLAMTPLTVGAALDTAENLAGDVANLAVAGVEGTVEAIAGLFGAKKSPPRQRVNRAALLDAIEKFLVEFGAGSALTRANLYTYRKGSVMLSSVQNHRPGQVAAQKHPWQATLSLRASVWTTKPLVPAGGSESAAFFKSVADEFGRDHTKAYTDLVLPFASKLLAKSLGHEGPDQWTGTLTLPLVVQHENALIAAYVPSDLQRALSQAVTHAWFPKPFFDRVAEDGNWVFGQAGENYVALYSMQPTHWATGDFQDNELRADGHNNIWICQVGTTPDYGPFDKFIATIRAAHIELVAPPIWDPGQIQCAYEAPTPRGSLTPFHRLELKYGLGGYVDGQPLTLDEFPRFENPYTTVGWGQRSYTIALRGLTLHHHLDTNSRQGDGL